MSDIFHLPVSVFDYEDPESFALAISRNFKEVERMLSILQLYMKQFGRPTIDNPDAYLQQGILYGLDAEKPKLR